jgi:flagellar basal body-associated protein FliL
MSSGHDPEANYQTGKGLRDLKNAFLLYLIGGFLNFVPVIGALGGIVIFVGFIFFIIGWRALGRSSLRDRDNYGSTGRWLIIGIILAIVISIVGVVAIVVSTFSYFVSHPYLINSTSSRTLPPNQLPGFTGIFEEGVGLAGILLVISFGIWIKMCSSIRKLGAELKEPRLKSAGLVYIINIVIGLVSIVVVALLFSSGSLSSIFTSSSALSRFSSQTRFLGILGYLTFGGFYSLLGLILIIGSLILLIGSYLGYSGLDSATKSYSRNFAPPPPLKPKRTFCSSCGHPANQEDIFCSNCGARLS